MTTAQLWMLQRLALETSAHHPAADEDRLALIGVRSLGAYRSFLIRIYGFEAAIELAIAKVLDEDLLRDRAKAGRLRQDLSTLGMNVRNIAAIPVANVRIDTPAEALGWLFVVERHTLIAGLLSRHIVHSFGLTAANAVAYLTAYGLRPGTQYRALGESIGVVAKRFGADQIVAAAHDAFRAQRHWYRASASDSRFASAAEPERQLERQVVLR